MKQVNFTHEGGFPLEQETLERLQTAYRFELFEALKNHLSIETKINNNYIVAHATIEKKGWAIIHQYEKDPKNTTEAQILQGILYPIKEGTATGYLKTTRKGTNLTFGTGVSQTAYFDYEAAYISQHDFSVGVPQNSDALIENYFELKNFKTVKDLQKIEEILDAVDAKITAIKTNIAKIEGDINVINDSYLPLKGYKAMEGDLNLGSYQLSKLDIKESGVANVRVADFRLGSIDRRGLLHPEQPTGRALVDSSDHSSTNLTLNHQSDWENTYIGGKVYLNNLNATNSGSLLIIDGSNQVTKSNTLIESLIKRITDLEEKPATAVPKGMIAIWGKPAPFPEGWEEYVPLRGRMPVGLNNIETEFNYIGKTAGSKNKKLEINEIPEHSHIYQKAIPGRGYDFQDRTPPFSGYQEAETSKAGKGDPFSILNPYRVVHFIEYTGNNIEPADIISPTSPTNLTASNIGTRSLTLTWTSSTDNVGVTNYLIYKDNSNTALAELGKDVLTYNVTGLSVNTPYSFQVKAKDAAGNLSDPVSLTTATLTADSTPPTLPSFFSCVHNGQGYILLEWAQSQDDDSPIDYELSRSAFGSLFTVLKKNPNTYYSEQVSSNGTYTYRVRAIDPSGNASGYKEASITISSL